MATQDEVSTQNEAARESAHALHKDDITIRESEALMRVEGEGEQAGYSAVCDGEDAKLDMRASRSTTAQPNRHRSARRGSVQPQRRAVQIRQEDAAVPSNAGDAARALQDDNDFEPLTDARPLAPIRLNPKAQKSGWPPTDRKARESKVSKDRVRFNAAQELCRSSGGVTLEMVLASLEKEAPTPARMLALLASILIQFTDHTNKRPQLKSEVHPILNADVFTSCPQSCCSRACSYSLWRPRRRWQSRRRAKATSRLPHFLSM
ncbi:hypothetical protein PybrP1_005003 [[Pythium] brassicae (nom. inval.)]|nr:hypothetical protein PybrP1_005003 [[Pythium] brassicae (nom. inval.)]